MKTLSLLALFLAVAACEPEKKDPVATKIDDTRVTSRDQTKIAFEKAGTGPVLVIVSGALSHRGLFDDELVPALAKHFTVYTYDRRGRGESTDVTPYAVEREIEDLQAVIRHSGNAAYVYGVSSGAALALQAAARLGPGSIAKLALYEPPYGQEPAAYAELKRRVNEAVAIGTPGEAAQVFLAGVGTPPDAIQGMKSSPQWKAIATMDFTLAYDYAILGDGAIPEDVAKAVTVPTLVMNGTKSMPFMRPTAERIAKLAPLGEHEMLEGQTHQVAADAVAPVLVRFFTRPPQSVSLAR